MSWLLLLAALSADIHAVPGQQLHIPVPQAVEKSQFHMRPEAQFLPTRRWGDDSCVVIFTPVREGIFYLFVTHGEADGSVFNIIVGDPPEPSPGPGPPGPDPKPVSDFQSKLTEIAKSRKAQAAGVRQNYQTIMQNINDGKYHDIASLEDQKHRIVADLFLLNAPYRETWRPFFEAIRDYMDPKEEAGHYDNLAAVVDTFAIVEAALTDALQ